MKKLTFALTAVLLLSTLAWPQQIGGGGKIGGSGKIARLAGGASLPSGNRTLWVNASDNDKLWKTYPTTGGNPADGELIESWDDEDATALLLQFASFGKPIWRSSGINSLGAVDFDGVDDQLHLEGGSPTLDTLISSTAATVFVSFRMEGAADNNSSQWLLARLISDEPGAGYFGLHLRSNGGTHEVVAYNYAGGATEVSKTISLDTDYVVMLRHESGNLYIAINNGAESSVASGTTDSLAGTIDVGGGSSAKYNGRIGEIAVYDVALSGSNLSDAWTYFMDKW